MVHDLCTLLIHDNVISMHSFHLKILVEKSVDVSL